MKNAAIARFLCLTLVLWGELLSSLGALAQQKDEGTGYVGDTTASKTPRAPASPVTPDHRQLFLIGYLNSDTTTANRAATVISITNQGSVSCEVSADWFRGLDPADAICTTVTTIEPGQTQEHCSRSLPDAIAVCQATCAPELAFDEGNAVVNVHKKCLKANPLAVDPRLYYTNGNADEEVAGIADLKVIRFGKANRGD